MNLDLTRMKEMNSCLCVLSSVVLLPRSCSQAGTWLVIPSYITFSKLSYFLLKTVFFSWGLSKRFCLCRLRWSEKKKSYYQKYVNNNVFLVCSGQPSSIGSSGLCHVLLLPPLQQPHSSHAAAQCKETGLGAVALAPQVRQVTNSWMALEPRHTWL